MHRTEEKLGNTLQSPMPCTNMDSLSACVVVTMASIMEFQMVLLFPLFYMYYTKAFYSIKFYNL